MTASTRGFIQFIKNLQRFTGNDLNDRLIQSPLVLKAHDQIQVPLGLPNDFFSSNFFYLSHGISIERKSN